MTTATARIGAGFLLADVDPESLATPERLTEEQRMLRETTRRFVESEILPILPELEKLNPSLLKGVLQKAGELGLCMIDTPEEYGGAGLDFISSIQPCEILSLGGGVSTAYSVQTVIGLLPILYFGTEEQKQKYIPGLVSAEQISAYALTEPGSGSDALAAKTTAVLSEDGSEWVLNGSKQFISNGGFADIFIVFAQVDGKHFSAFIVERETPGFSVGAEEHKMGIKSSSTTTLSFADCRIPKDHLIGEVGWGGKIALNVLNVGRLKLGVGSIGNAKEALEEATKYALERRQFGHAIADFGIIREKIAQMAAFTYAGESAMTRTAGLISEAIQPDDGSAATPQVMMTTLHEFNVECAIVKVFASEVHNLCTDEAVQIHGGYGFIEEYKVARLYRDARIARLYEGTSEINRMQIAGDILKRVAKGSFDLVAANGSPGEEEAFGSLAGVASQLREWKSVVARLVALIGEGHGGTIDKRGENQELLQRLADIIISIFTLESAMGRAIQARRAGSDNAEMFEAMTWILAASLAFTVQRSTSESITFLTQAGGMETVQAEIESLALGRSCNVIPLRRKVAKAMFDREGAWFNE